MVEPVSLARPWRDNAISGCVTGMPLVNSTDCIWECAELRERSGDGQMVTVELKVTQGLVHGSCRFCYRGGKADVVDSARPS